MLNFARHEVMYYFRNKVEVIELYSFIITVNLLLSFGLRSALTVNSELMLAGLWLALAASAALGASTLFERDRQSGRLELYQLLPNGIEAIVFSKWLAFYLVLALPLVLAVPVMGFLGAGEHLLQLALGLGVGAVGMSLIACFSAAMMVGGGRGTALLSLISLPLMVPIMIFGTAYCRQPDLFNPSLIFLGAYGLFLLPCTIIASASAIRASN